MSDLCRRVPVPGRGHGALLHRGDVHQHRHHGPLRLGRRPGPQVPCEDAGDECKTSDMMMMMTRLLAMMSMWR